MSSNVREAAERLRRFTHELMQGTVVESARVDYEGVDAAHITLAEAYLAAFPADDDEPVSEEWLRSVGFVSQGKYGETSLCFTESAIGYANTKTTVHIWKAPTEWQVRIDLLCCNRHKSFETRGDVRRLCQALGIELKEQANV